MKKLFLIFSLVLLSPLFAGAVLDTTLGGSLVATITPANPGPRTDTTIILQSFSTDLASATLTWSVDGKQVQSGVGKSAYTFTTGTVGNETRIFITVAGQDGSSIEKTLVFTPEDVALSWEADTYTPLLYEGRALPGPGAVVRVFANPLFKTATGRIIDPKDLTYSWSQDFKDVANGSGQGLQSVEIKTKVLGTTKMSVDIASNDGTLRTTKTLEIPTVSPKILFYEERPLEGTRIASSLASVFSLIGNEVTVRAEPFFFSLPQTSVALSWLMNGNPAVADPGNGLLITLRHDPGVTGTARIEASASRPGFVFQAGRSAVTVHF